MFKKLSAIILAIALVLSLTACSASAPAERPISHLVCGTSASTGTYYSYGGNWSKVMNSKVQGVDISCEVSGGPTKNIQGLEMGDMDLAFVTAWQAGEAFNGVGEFEGNKSTKARALFPMYSSVMYIFTIEGRGIETIQDLAGKTVGTGSPGGTSDKAARLLLKTLGIEPREISSLSSDVAANAIADGLVDAAFYVGSIPASYLLNLETTNKLKFIQLSDADYQKIFDAYPYWAKDAVPAGTYKNQDSEMSFISFWNYAVASEDLDEILAYDLVKATFDNNDTFLTTDKNFATTLAENIDKIVTPLHPGAYRYYKELGIDIPKSIIPQ